MQIQPDVITEIITEIGRTLRFQLEAIPAQIDEKRAAEVLGVRVSTLANWRTTGRYSLPYIKVGRLVRYRVTDLAQWIAKRRQGAEG